MYKRISPNEIELAKAIAIFLKREMLSYPGLYIDHATDTEVLAAGAFVEAFTLDATFVCDALLLAGVLKEVEDFGYEVVQVSNEIRLPEKFDETSLDYLLQGLLEVYPGRAGWVVPSGGCSSCDPQFFSVMNAMVGCGYATTADGRIFEESSAFSPWMYWNKFWGFEKLIRATDLQVDTFFRESSLDDLANLAKTLVSDWALRLKHKIEIFEGPFLSEWAMMQGTDHHGSFIEHPRIARTMPLASGVYLRLDALRSQKRSGNQGNRPNTTE